MKFFILFLFVCMMSISCDEQNSKKDADPPLKGHFDNPNVERNNTEKKENKGIQKESKMNQLRAEEDLLKQDRQLAGIKYEFNFDGDKEVDPICRRFAGCLKFCTWRDQQNKRCNQWPVSAVIALWEDAIDGFSNEELVHNVDWIAKDSDIALFLYDSDRENKILKKLMKGFSKMECPFIESADVYYAHLNKNEHSSLIHDSLFLSHPDGKSFGVKKIISTEFYDFDLPVFKGFVKKCLGNDEEKKISFIEQTALNGNWRGFMLAHQTLMGSCGEYNECVRLAYCKLDFLRMYENVNALNTGKDFILNDLKCSYSDFNSLPI